MQAGRAILTTIISEIMLSCAKQGGVIPKSSVYLALGCDLELTNAVLQAAELADLLKCTSETVSLTDKGMEMLSESSEAV